MKWYGDIGFKEEIEEEPGWWTPTITVRSFFGDILGERWGQQQGDKINADLHISNRLSVVADQYLQNNFHKIAYVTFGGAKWTVTDVEVQFPRLTLTLGSLYLEETDED